MRMAKVYIFSTLFLMIFSAAYAMPQQGCGGSCTECHSLTLSEANEILREVGVVKQVRPAAMNGLWEIRLEKEGRQGVAFMDFGKKFLLPGPIFPINNNRSAVPAEVQKKSVKLEVETIPIENAILMGNQAGKKKLFVFTDPDCPYCASQHVELKKLVEEDKDFLVYVMLFPLLDLHPHAYNKSRVILGEKSLKLLDTAFGGELPLPATNSSGKVVDEIIAFGRSVGIVSTPTLVLPDGRIMPGFRDAAAIRNLFKDKSISESIRKEISQVNVQR